MLFFSSSAAPELLIPNEAIFQNAIKDHQRLERILAIREEVKTAEQVLSEMFNNRYGELAKLSPQYEADINQFRVIFDELDLVRFETQSIYLDKRFQLKEQMTPEEWKKVYGSR